MINPHSDIVYILYIYILCIIMFCRFPFILSAGRHLVIVLCTQCILIYIILPIILSDPTRGEPSSQPWVSFSRVCVLLFADADRDVRRAVPAVRRLLRAERDSAVRVQRKARGVRAQRQHESVREVRTGPGGERDMRPGGAADQGGHRGRDGRQARRRRVGRRCGRVASGRGDGGRTAAQLRRRLLEQGGLARARRTAAAVRGGATAGNVQEPVRRHHGRRRGQDPSLQQRQRQDGRAPGRRQAEDVVVVVTPRRRRQVYRARGLFALGPLFPRAIGPRRGDGEGRDQRVSCGRDDTRSARRLQSTRLSRAGARPCIPHVTFQTASILARV